MKPIQPKASSISLEEIYKKLRDSGSRLTPQREYILDVFFKADSGLHLSPEDVFRVLSETNKLNVSLATVYRTVKTLYLMGVLREVDLAEGHKHYELASGNNEPHHHIVCLNCNKTIEFSSLEVNRLALEIAKNYNVEIHDVELKILGKCLHFENENNDLTSTKHRR